jgi:hypothetical protein
MQRVMATAGAWKPQLIFQQSTTTPSRGTVDTSMTFC